MTQVMLIQRVRPDVFDSNLYGSPYLMFLRQRNCAICGRWLTFFMSTAAGSRALAT